jgi:hypothetical protein
MGRSLAPATQLILDQIAEVKPLYEALRRSDQLILDGFFDSIAQHRAAIANAASLLPLEAMLVVMQLEGHKMFEHVLNKMYAEVLRLEWEVEELRSACMECRRNTDPSTTVS